MQNQWCYKDLGRLHKTVLQKYLLLFWLFKIVDRPTGMCEGNSLLLDIALPGLDLEDMLVVLCGQMRCCLPS